MGALAAEARTALGRTKKKASAEAGIADSTLRAFETAAYLRVPSRDTMRALEVYYGWRTGAMLAIWDNRRSLSPAEVTLASVLPEPEAPPAGLLKAQHLTDQELMAELNFRFLMRDNRHQFDG
jgi:hypothetical protein